MSLIKIVNNCQELLDGGRINEAIDQYQAWIKKSKDGLNYVAYYNLAVIFQKESRVDEAIAAYKESIKINEYFIEAKYNLSILYDDVGNQSDAASLLESIIEVCRIDIKNKSIYIYSLNKLADKLIFIKKESEAKKLYIESFLTERNQIFLIEKIIDISIKFCSLNLDLGLLNLSETELLNNCSLKAMPTLSDDVEGIYLRSETYLQNINLQKVMPISSNKRYKHEGLRIGYVCDALSVEKCKRIHEQSTLCNTEIHIFNTSYDLALNDFNIHGISNEKSSHFIRDKEIDVLVLCNTISYIDLVEILSYRPAPIQLILTIEPVVANFPFVDGILLSQFNFHINDYFLNKLSCFYFDGLIDLYSDKIKNLKKGGFLFEALMALDFNCIKYFSSFESKNLSPDVLDCWFKILMRNVKSIIVINIECSQSRENIYKYALVNSIDTSRVLFSCNEDCTDEAMELIDVFLDTFPYNACDKAYSALMNGIPVITCTGNSYASKATASLLSKINIEFLISINLNEYEEMALSLNRSNIKYYKNLILKPINAEFNNGKALSESLIDIYNNQLFKLSPPVEKFNATNISLDYLVHPYSKVRKNSKRYVIVAPAFVHNSAGIRVLYDLQKWLTLAGYDAIICTWFSGYPVDQFSEDIVIYPEVAPGNLLKSKRVVRYILNTPGKLGHGEKTYHDSELLVAYSKDLSVYTDGLILQVPTIESFFYSDETVKDVDAYYVGKGVNSHQHPAHCIEISKTYPSSRTDLADLLRRVKILYLYDDYSMIAHEAKICGCEIKLISKNNSIINFEFINLFSLEEFKLQLHNFIEITQKL